MINLIPTSAKKQVVIEYWLRVITVWFLLVSLTALIGAAVMLPVYVLLKEQISVYQESADKAQEKMAVFENVSSDLVAASQQAKIILDNQKDATLSKYIYMFSSLETEALILSSITVSRDGEVVAPVQLSGVASDRQALADFRDRLLAIEDVKAVDFPISNLAKDKDIPFGMTVTLVNKPAI